MPPAPLAARACATDGTCAVMHEDRHSGFQLWLSQVRRSARALHLVRGHRAATGIRPHHWHRPAADDAIEWVSFTHSLARVSSLRESFMPAPGSGRPLAGPRRRHMGPASPKHRFFCNPADRTGTLTDWPKTSVTFSPYSRVSGKTDSRLSASRFLHLASSTLDKSGNA